MTDFLEISVGGLVVYDSVLFERGRDVNRWINSVERNFTRNAILEAPINKRPNKSPGEPPVGALRAGIWGDTAKVGPKHWQAVIHSDAHYTKYVLGGTSAIFPHGKFLKLPSNPGRGPRTRFNVVPGQSANNFLDRAAERTAVQHPSLRGMHFLFGQA